MIVAFQKQTTNYKEVTQLNQLHKKHLMFDKRMIFGKETICTLIDLQTCYIQQLGEIGSIVEESPKKDRAAVKSMCNSLFLFRYN